MFLKIKQSINNRFFKQSKKIAPKNVSIFPNDVFLVSYPKSGNTWLRFLIANLIYFDSTVVSFSNIEKLVPDIYKHLDKDLLRLPSPRIMKSHECFNSRYPKVIYLVRDPRDVAVSYYHYLIKVKTINEDYPIDLWIKPFIKGEFNPQYGTWSENVKSWISSENNSNNLLLVKYENMLENSFQEMKTIALFLGLKVEKDSILKAIESSSAKHMLQLEKESGWQPQEDSRTDKTFVRVAKSGNWKTELTKCAAMEIENNWQLLMQKLHYLK